MLLICFSKNTNLCRHKEVWSLCIKVLNCGIFTCEIDILFSHVILIFFLICFISLQYTYICVTQCFMNSYDVQTAVGNLNMMDDKYVCQSWSLLRMTQLEDIYLNRGGKSYSILPYIANHLQWKAFTVFRITQLPENFSSKFLTRCMSGFLKLLLSVTLLCKLY